MVRQELIEMNGFRMLLALEVDSIGGDLGAVDVGIGDACGEMVVLTSEGTFVWSVCVSAPVVWGGQGVEWEDRSGPGWRGAYHITMSLSSPPGLKSASLPVAKSLGAWFKGSQKDPVIRSLSVTRKKKENPKGHV